MILTEAGTTSTTVGLWAVPVRNPEPREFPFFYDLFGFGENPTHWREGAVLIKKVPITAEIPAGIDLLQKALDTLDVQEVRALQEYSDKMEKIKGQRKVLTMFLPTPAHGELVLEHDVPPTEPTEPPNHEYAEYEEQ